MDTFFRPRHPVRIVWPHLAVLLFAPGGTSTCRQPRRHLRRMPCSRSPSSPLLALRTDLDLTTSSTAGYAGSAPGGSRPTGDSLGHQPRLSRLHFHAQARCSLHDGEFVPPTTCFHRGEASSPTSRRPDAEAPGRNSRLRPRRQTVVFLPAHPNAAFLSNPPRHLPATVELSERRASRPPI